SETPSLDEAAEETMRPKTLTILMLRTVAAAVALVLLIGRVSMSQSQSGPTGDVPPLGLNWTGEQITGAVGAVRAGRKLTPPQWPNGSRVAVAITFDVDNELLSRNSPLPAPLSQGEFGATTALPRIL